MLPLRDLVLLSLAVSIPFSFGNLTEDGLWISLGWLCLSALAVLLAWRQPGPILKALSVLAAYLLVMSGRSVVEGTALALSDNADGLLLFVALTVVVFGSALATVAVGVYRQQRWALWGALFLGFISLFNIAQTVLALSESGVSMIIVSSVAMRGVIWTGVVAFSAYLLRKKELLRQTI